MVIVEIWEGKTEDQKEKLIQGITKAFEEMGVKAERLTIIIHDVPKSNWGSGENRHLRPSPSPWRIPQFWRVRRDASFLYKLFSG